MRKKILILVCLLVCCMLVASAVVVAPKPPDKPGKPGGGGDLGTEYQITNLPGQEEYPRIDGNIVVWADRRNGYRYDIYAYYLGPDGIPFTGDAHEGEYQISSDPEGEDWPMVHGNKIVWRRFARDDPYRKSNIVMDHLGDDGIPGTGDTKEGEYWITYTNESEARPDVYGNLIVWMDYGGAEDLGITLLDLGDNGLPDATDNQLLIPGSVGGDVPKIDGNNVVFRINDDIGIYHISGPGQGQTDIHDTPYRSGEMYWGWPEISGNIFVWPDDRNSKNPNRPDVSQWINWDIYMYDLGDDGVYGTSDDGGESPVADSKNDEWWPAIHGNKVVFISGSSTAVGVHDLTTGKTGKISSSGSTGYPDVFLDHIVYHNGEDGTEDIYLYILD